MHILSPEDWGAQQHEHEKQATDRLERFRHPGSYHPVFDFLFEYYPCLLYTSPSPRDQRGSRMPSSA